MCFSDANSGFVLLTAKYKNISVASMRWSHDAYVAIPRVQAVLHLVSPEDLADLLVSRSIWRKSIKDCFESELRAAEHHHVCSLQQIDGNLRTLRFLAGTL